MDHVAHVTWKDEAAAIAHASSYADTRGEAIGRRAYVEGCCILHAAYLVAVDAREAGELPHSVCPYCGGPAGIRIGFHHLCATRARHGRPTPRLDIFDAMRCECHDCREVV